MYSIGKITKLLGYHLENHRKDGTVRGFCIDSRQLRQGDCFIAIKGDRFDGNTFAQAAIKAGASCVVVDNQQIHSEILATEGNSILVSDSITALGLIASDYRNQLKAKVIAITGSACKTSTREMIKHILSRYYKSHGAIKSFNNNIGMPLTILSTPLDAEFLVLEIGTNHPGEIEPLTKIARPDIALITNVYPSHIGNFGSIENIAKEKVSICNGLSEDGVVFASNQIEIDNMMRQRAINYRPLSIEKTDDANVLSPTNYKIGDTCSIEIAGKTITIPIAGKASICNILSAYAVCIEAGLTPTQIAQATNSLVAVEGRMSFRKVGNSTIIDDCYNCNPGSLANAIETISQMESNGRKVAVLGDMKELGDDSRKYHRLAGEAIAKAKIDIVLAIGDYAKTLAEAAYNGSNISIAFDDFEKLKTHLLTEVEGNETILIKGSRSMQLERILEPLLERIKTISNIKG